MNNNEKESVQNGVENNSNNSDELSADPHNEYSVQGMLGPPVPVEYMLINKCYGGFSLSQQGEEEVKRRCGCDLDFYRHCAIAIALFDEKGSEWCSGKYTKLEKVGFPAGFRKWARVSEYDGLEYLVMDWDGAFTDGVKEIISKMDGTIEEIRELEATIEAAKEAEEAIDTWERQNCY